MARYTLDVTFSNTQKQVAYGFDYVKKNDDKTFTFTEVIAEDVLFTDITTAPEDYEAILEVYNQIPEEDRR